MTLAGGLLFTRQLVGVFASDGTAVFDLAVFGFSIYSICFLFKGTNIFASALFTALSDGENVRNPIVSAYVCFYCRRDSAAPSMAGRERRMACCSLCGDCKHFSVGLLLPYKFF